MNEMTINEQIRFPKHQPITEWQPIDTLPNKTIMLFLRNDIRWTSAMLWEGEHKAKISGIADLTAEGFSPTHWAEAMIDGKPMEAMTAPKDV